MDFGNRDRGPISINNTSIYEHSQTLVYRGDFRGRADPVKYSFMYVVCQHLMEMWAPPENGKVEDESERSGHSLGQGRPGHWGGVRPLDTTFTGPESHRTRGHKSPARPR